MVGSFTAVAGRYPDKVQPLASDFRSQLTSPWLSYFNMGRKSFNHSLEVISQSNFHWEREHRAGIALL